MISKECLVQEKIQEQITVCLGSSGWSLQNTTAKVAYSEKLLVGHYLLTLGPVRIAEFTLSPMINCCGICVSTQATVCPAFRGRGLGLLLNSLRIDIARFLGYGLLLCTNIEQNTPQRHIMKKNGWCDIWSFVNPRTQNRVFISCINL